MRRIENPQRISYRFLHEATNPLSYRFLREATGYGELDHQKCYPEGIVRSREMLPKGTMALVWTCKPDIN